MTALSPWPTTPAALTAARETLAAAIGVTILADAGDDREAALAKVNRLGGVAAAMVEDYASAAPQVLRNEALIRFAAYLQQATSFTTTAKTIGPVSVDMVTNHAPAFRNSGAAMLLTRWRQRRAGAA